MKISTRIYISTITSLLLFVLFLSLIITLSTRIQDELENDKIADSLLENTTALILLIDEFLITESERSNHQWNIIYNKILTILSDNEEMWYSDVILPELELLQKNYTKLREEIIFYNNHIEPLTPTEERKFQNLKEMLSSQLILNSQSILSHSFRISSSSDKNISSYNSRILVLLTVLSTIIPGVFIYLSLWVIFRISVPLSKLAQGVNIVSNGDLNYEFKGFPVKKSNDEVYVLESGFNKMTHSLNTAFTSLNEEIHKKEKQAGEILKLQNYLNSFINAIPSLLIGIDSRGIITQWNDSVRELTGIPQKDALGHELKDILPERGKKIIEISKNYTVTEAVQSDYSYTYKGAACFEDIAVYPLIHDDSHGFVIRIDDITEQTRMKEMMIQSEKMLSVGGLAAGMAHEINNPLAGIIQTTSVVKERLTNGALSANIRAAEEAGTTIDKISHFMQSRNIITMLRSINDTGQRVVGIIHNMLSFARKSEGSYSLQNLDNLCERALELAVTDYDMKKHYDFKLIKITKDFQEKTPKVRCETSKILQVLLNILRNGSQAMQSAGTESPSFYLKTSYIKDENMVSLIIRDNGPGMEEAVRKRIFEPFFTTKGVGVGTGLGLSVSYFIITENHHGKISVESSVGQGCQFTIKLPADHTSFDDVPLTADTNADD